MAGLFPDRPRISEKGLEPNIYIYIYIYKFLIKQPDEKMGNKYEQLQDTKLPINKEKSSTSLMMREMQTTQIYHYTAIEIAIIKNDIKYRPVLEFS